MYGRPMVSDHTVTRAATVRTRVVFVSGFLGAGKTTSIESLGTALTDRGYTVGMITNDQARGLVDTSVLGTTSGEVEEIAGGCFCCNFEELLGAARSVLERDVDVLLCEPVGSCTDLVATVINPLRSIHSEEFAVAPLTAVLDPDRVRSYLAEDGTEGGLPAEVRYIFRKQIEEADLVVLNKTDTLAEEETARLVDGLERRVANRPVLTMSAERGTGIERWLSLVLGDVAADDEPEADRSLPQVERRPLSDIDYDTYAEGEARLGWVNLSSALVGPFEASRFRRALMERIQAALETAGVEVAHLKFSVGTEEGLARANLTATDATPDYGGTELGTVDTARLVINARAVGDPEEIQATVSDALDGTAMLTGVTVIVDEIQAFRPAYPEPVHRMDSTVRED